MGEHVGIGRPGAPPQLVVGHPHPRGFPCGYAAEHHQHRPLLPKKKQPRAKQPVTTGRLYKYRQRTTIRKGELREEADPILARIEEEDGEEIFVSPTEAEFDAVIAEFEKASAEEEE